MPCRLYLLDAVRTIIRADSDPARQTLFARVARARPSVGLLVWVHAWLSSTRLAAWLVSVYGLAAYVRVAIDGPTAPRVVGVAGHDNARRQVARLLAWIGSGDSAWMGTGRPDVGATLRLLCRPRDLARVVRLVRRVDARWGFLVSCRAAATLAWYARATERFAADRPGAVLVSSSANPEEAGALAAARALGIPQIYVSHAYPTPFSPPLDFTLSMLEGEAAADAYRERGPVRGRVLLIGVEGDSAEMDAGRIDRHNPTIGLFPPKAFSWEALAGIIEDCRQHHRASKVLIRWHPSMLEPPRLSQRFSRLDGIVETDRAAPLEAVARQCDWVVAGENSNVHLPVLKLGIPTVAVKDLGLYGGTRADLYGFVAHRIVLPPVGRLRDLDSHAVHAFFSDGWAARFARYDASYLRGDDDLIARVRQAVEDAVAHRQGERPPA
jgi:hypothetical protein